MERRTLLQLLAATGLSAQTLPSADARLSRLCELTVPGAVEAGAPQFVELLASENADYRKQLTVGWAWMEARCEKQFGKTFVRCGDNELKSLFDEIAYRENVAKEPGLATGVEFFAFVRDLALDAYFTSKKGIEYLGFQGNAPQARFDGCP